MCYRSRKVCVHCVRIYCVCVHFLRTCWVVGGLTLEWVCMSESVRSVVSGWCHIQYIACHLMFHGLYPNLYLPLPPSLPYYSLPPPIFL